MALLIAFACCWTCVNLVAGNVGMQALMCVEMSVQDVEAVESAEAVAGINGTPFPPGGVARTIKSADDIRARPFIHTSRGQWGTTDPCHSDSTCFSELFAAAG